MNLFQMKSKPHGIERLPLFLQRGFVAIGWPGIGSLDGVDAEEIEERLAKVYPSYVGQKMAYYKGIVNAFANTMSAGDIVMITEGDFVHVGRLEDYQYKKEYDNEEGMCHQRPVEWLSTVGRNTLNEKVQEHIRNRATVTRFKYPFQLADLDDLIRGNSCSSGSMDKASLIDRAWDILEQELQSDNPIVRVTAAAAIVKAGRK